MHDHFTLGCLCVGVLDRNMECFYCRLSAHLGNSIAVLSSLVKPACVLFSKQPYIGGYWSTSAFFSLHLSHDRSSRCSNPGWTNQDSTESPWSFCATTTEIIYLSKKAFQTVWWVSRMISKHCSDNLLWKIADFWAFLNHDIPVIDTSCYCYNTTLREIV